MAEATTHRTAESTEHHAPRDEGDKTPTPTQGEMDEILGGKDHKKREENEKREAEARLGQKAPTPEELVPTPTQAENDDIKAKLFNTTVEEDKKRNAKYVEEHGEKSAKDGEDLTPTPTQQELDDTKKEILYEPEDNPGGGTDPQKAEAKRKTLEAGKPGGNYQTRAIPPNEPAITRAPAHPKSEKSE